MVTFIFSCLQKFLIKPDMNTHSSQHIPVYDSGDTALTMKNASFAWDDSDAEGIANKGSFIYCQGYSIEKALDLSALQSRL